MRHSLFRSTCLGLLCVTLAATNPISDFKIRARSLNFAKDGEEIAQNVKISEVSKGLDDTKVNLVEEKELSESEKSPLLSKQDQSKIDDVERTQTNSKKPQTSGNEKPIDRSESSSSSSSSSESESESKETSNKEPQKPKNSLIEQFKQMYQNWKKTIISNWKKHTSMEPLEKEETKTYPESKPGIYKHWYRTSDSILARLFRGIRRYFTLNKPQPVKGPLKPKVEEKAPTTETKLAESTKDLPTATGSKDTEKPKEVQVGSEVDPKKTS